MYVLSSGKLTGRKGKNENNWYIEEDVFFSCFIRYSFRQADGRMIDKYIGRNR